MPYTPRFFLVVFFLILAESSYCQPNVRVGYIFSGINGQPYNRLVKHFNEKSQGRHSLSDMRYLHGFCLGIQYTLGRLSFGLGWEYGLNREKDLNKDPATGQEVVSRLGFTWQSYSLNVEAKWGWIGLGTRVSYDEFKAKWIERAGAAETTVVGQNGLGTGLFANIYLDGKGSMGIIIQPHFSVLWPKVKLHAMSQWAGSHQENADWGVKKWGIALIFNNGNK